MIDEKVLDRVFVEIQFDFHGEVPFAKCRRLLSTHARGAFSVGQASITGKIYPPLAGSTGGAAGAVAGGVVGGAVGGVAGVLAGNVSAGVAGGVAGVAGVAVAGGVGLAVGTSGAGVAGVAPGNPAVGVADSAGDFSLLAPVPNLSLFGGL
jgi:hypothetical protein